MLHKLNCVHGHQCTMHFMFFIDYQCQSSTLITSVSQTHNKHWLIVFYACMPSEHIMAFKICQKNKISFMKKGNSGRNIFSIEKLPLYKFCQTFAFHCSHMHAIRMLPIVMTDHSYLIWMACELSWFWREFTAPTTQMQHNFWCMWTNELSGKTHVDRELTP